MMEEPGGRGSQTWTFLEATALNCYGFLCFLAPKCFERMHTYMSTSLCVPCVYRCESWTIKMAFACSVISIMSKSLRPQWTVAHQAPLSMGFSRQEFWSGLPCLLQGIFLTCGYYSQPDSGIVILCDVQFPCKDGLAPAHLSPASFYVVQERKSSSMH